MSGIRGSEAGRDGGSGVRGAPLSCLHLINSASHFLKITLAGTKKTRCTVLAHEPMLESQGGGNGSMGGGAGEDFECTAVSANKLLLPPELRSPTLCPTTKSCATEGTP